MIVVDANIVAYYMIRGARSAEVHSLRDRDPHWIIPPLWRYEFQNVLVTYVSKRGMPVEQCRLTWEQALNVFSEHEKDVPSWDAILLAITHAISVYDACYIRLACSERVPCVTEDRELLRKFPDTAVSISNYLRGASPLSLHGPSGRYRHKRKHRARRDGGT